MKNEEQKKKRTGIIQAFFALLFFDFSTMASGVLAASVGMVSCRNALNGFSTK